MHQELTDPKVKKVQREIQHNKYDVKPELLFKNKIANKLKLKAKHKTKAELTLKSKIISKKNPYIRSKKNP